MLEDVPTPREKVREICADYSTPPAEPPTAGWFALGRRTRDHLQLVIVTAPAAPPTTPPAGEAA